MSLRLCIVLSAAFVAPAAIATFWVDGFLAGFAYGVVGMMFLRGLADHLRRRAGGSVG